MHKYKIGTRILIIIVIITLLGTIIFTTLIPLSVSWLLGWVIGSISVLFTYLISLLLIKKSLSKIREFKKGLLLSSFRISITYLVQIGLILSIVSIDKYASGYSFMQKGAINTMYGPINIFTYIAGVSIVFISTILTHIFFKKGV